MRTISSAGFGEASPLTLDVPGYATFRLLCDENGTPALADDDFVRFDVTNGLGASAIQSGLISSAGFALDPPVIAAPAVDGELPIQDGECFVDGCQIGVGDVQRDDILTHANFRFG